MSLLSLLSLIDFTLHHESFFILCSMPGNFDLVPHIVILPFERVPIFYIFYCLMCWVTMKFNIEQVCNLEACYTALFGNPRQTTLSLRVKFNQVPVNSNNAMWMTSFSHSGFRNTLYSQPLLISMTLQPAPISSPVPESHEVSSRLLVLTKTRWKMKGNP